MSDKTRKDYKQLRKMFDSNEPFLAGGHRTKQIRQGNHPVPDWAHDNEKVQKILLKSFPKLNTNVSQRLRAGRWARVIQLYFRQNMTHTQIRYELAVYRDGRVIPVSMPTVKSLIRSIKRVANGLRTDWAGKAPSKRPAGRPRKISATSPASIGS